MSLYPTSSEEALATLRQDMPRTFPTHALFLGDRFRPSGVVAASADASHSQRAAYPGCRRRALYHILASYASFNVSIGYCQGASDDAMGAASDALGTCGCVTWDDSFTCAARR